MVILILHLINDISEEISAITCTELDTICVTWNTHIIDKI